MDKVVKEITQDLANAIIRGDTMVPVCNLGPLLEYIEKLEMEKLGCEFEQVIEDNFWELVLK